MATEAAISVPSVQVEGVEVVPGMEFDADRLPEAESSYSAPSCAFDGSDNTYSYDGFEITAMDDGKTETIYSIFLLGDSASTAEGLSVGDSLEKAEELYGDDYDQEGSACIYEYDSGLKMSVIVRDGTIESIELRADI